MLIPGEKVPELDLPLVGGKRFVLSEQRPDVFTMLVFYRGLHCPLCRNYLQEIATRIDEFSSLGISPVAIVMDDEVRARKAQEEWEIGSIPLAYNLSETSAREWGLYISEKRSGSQEPDLFAEPGLFLVRPGMELFFAQVQSAPFTRPPVEQLLQGMKFAIANDYPARGTLTASSDRVA